MGNFLIIVGSILLIVGITMILSNPLINVSRKYSIGIAVIFTILYNLYWWWTFNN